MNIYEIAELIVNKSQVRLIRTNKKTGVLEHKEYVGSKKGWMIFDLFSASIVRTVIKNVSKELQDKLLSLDAHLAIASCLNIYNKACK